VVTSKSRLPPAGREALDARDFEQRVAETTLREIGRTNALFGGHAAVAFGLRELVHGLPPAKPITVLDIGAGDCDVTDRARGVLGTRRTKSFALDHHRAAARMCRVRAVPTVVGDMWHLPVRPASVDIILVSLVLHHVARSDAPAFLSQLDQAARLGVVVTDLRRSLLAAAGFALAGRVLGFHDVTRQDGQISIRRGFTAAELGRLLASAGIRNAVVRRRAGWRLVAYWRTQHADG